MLRFLQFSCRLTASLIVKICPFRCLCGYYGDSLDVMFPNFLTISYRFPRCFRMFRRVSLLFPLIVSRVSYFRFCDEISRIAILKLPNLVKFRDFQHIDKLTFLIGVKYAHHIC